ncbi:uncharacterized protein MAM_05085 [Metarhizium album ARSEF 1941]|uniref:DNA/RNA-binding protein Alba-like domain-containing protein n=1 Tax=Metarhizium album (strain ARSEF 1941) TaxID=1081103 RepID=A0A0B2WLN9_METAS|nr:uncharacterized protein MAM_05085 [Metarhizium album ARSEF 1941]KHN96976.1 hypothetical protein MAM_05085 [Metarhizium album ARSEF 1941]
MSPEASQETCSASQKRKEPSAADRPAERCRSQPFPPGMASKPALIGPHEAIIAQLQPKYNVLAASVISSTQIRKRVMQAVSHLGSTSDLPNVVLLHARTAEVCKMITIVEQCKRVLREQGKTCLQYNEMFPLPETEGKDVVEETVLERDDGEGENAQEGDSEVMASRFEKAVIPEPSKRATMSLRVILSMEEVGVLKDRKGVTVQTSESK